MTRSQPHRLPGRLAFAFAIVAWTLEVASLVFYSAATKFSPRLSVAPTTLLASGRHGAALIRWGSLVDMFGYLCVPPVVLYLRNRYAEARFIDLFALAGLSFVIIGSIGAAVMATSAPDLIAQSQREPTPSGRHSLELVFGALYRAVVEGMWQTLETVPAAVWLIGTAMTIRAQAPRRLFWILLPLGLANGGIALFRLAAP